MGRQVTARQSMSSYCPADGRWAARIAWQLEVAGFWTLLRAWDLPPGSPVEDFVERGMRSAAVVVAVLSRAYLGSAAPRRSPRWHCGPKRGGERASRRRPLSAARGHRRQAGARAEPAHARPGRAPPHAARPAPRVGGARPGRPLRDRGHRQGTVLARRRLCRFEPGDLDEVLPEIRPATARQSVLSYRRTGSKILWPRRTSHAKAPSIRGVLLTS